MKWYNEPMNEMLSRPVQWALNRLASCHYEAYAVGGCVRDMLLGRTPHDWDVCTSATPDEVIECFANVRVVATGIRHGTVTAILDDEPVEITTYRVDGGYSDHRHPDQVVYTKRLEEDLARRDFTINAMAYRPDTGMIDPYGGRDDLQRGRIRCVGDPDARFTEDALRMLRAIRFASRFDFAIEAATADALLRHKDALRYVAAERVLSELVRTDWARVDSRFLPLIQVVLPEVQAIDVRPGLPSDPAIRMAALLRGLDAGRIMRRLRASRALADRVSRLVRYMDTPMQSDRICIKRVLRDIGPEATGQLLLIQDNLQGLETLADILARDEAYSLRQLDIDGRDLAKMGLEGRLVGDALEGLLTKVIEGELPNENNTLRKAVEIAGTLNGVF